MRTLNGKITFFGIVICVLTGLIVSIFSVVQSHNYFVSSKVKESEHNLDLFAESIQSKVNELKSDIQFLSSTPPVRGILRSTENAGIDPKDGSSLKMWEERLAVIFEEMLYAKNKYTQIRYIGFANEGRELIRVERQGQKVLRITEGKLQRKNNESYFKKAMATDANKVYLSQFTLNREFGKITYPLQMVLRAAVPIYGDDGNPFGIVIVNVDYTSLFKGLENFTDRGVEFFVLNDENTVLLDSKNENEFITGKGFKTLEEGPSLSLFDKSNNKVEKIKDSNKLFSDREIYVFKKIYYNSLDPTEFLAISLEIDRVSLMDDIMSDLSSIFLLLLLLVSISVLLSILFAKKIVSPLKQLMKLTKKISSGKSVDFNKYEVIAKDEVGKLTHTLLDLSRDVLKKNKQLVSQKLALDSSAIVAETDLNGIITYVNDKFLEISKYSREELVGRDHRVLNSKHHPKEFFQYLWKTISSGNIWKEEIKNRAKDGSYYWVSTTIFPIKDENGELNKFISIRFDITGRKKIEEELILASNEIKKAMDIKSNFLANMSHEIRTPLNSILGLADVLAETKMTQEQQKYLSSLASSGDSLLKLVNDILDLSKIEAGELNIDRVEFNVEKLNEEIIEMISIEAQKKNVEILFDFDFDIPHLLFGDSLRLRQILINLLGNAIKFTREGHVSFSVKLLRKNDSDHSIDVEFEISDTGIGIKKENLNMIFDSFSQADSSITRAFGGTGLGLNIVKKLVKKMNGDLFVESEEGVGSTFKFIIPYEYNSRCLIQKTQVEYLLSGKNVLLVDDSHKNCKVLNNILEHWGAVVENEKCGKIALDKIQSENKYEFVFIDSHVSIDDGEKLISKLDDLDLLDESYIVMQSPGEFEVDKLKEELFLIKPIKKSDLESIIESSLKYECKGRILLIDDEEILLKVAQDLLIPLGYEIHITQDTNEALRLFKLHDFDAIVTDYNLPKRSCIELIREIREIDSDIPISILSGFIDHEIIKEKESLNIFDYVEKPYHENDLVQNVKSMITARKLSNKNKHESQKLTESIKILVADDSVINRNLLMAYFKNENYSVDYVANGEEAVISTLNFDYDMVLMDMQMPVMDGCEATRKIRQWEHKSSRPKMPIVALTANVLQEDRDKSFEAGCSDFLTKPIKKKELINFINEKYKKAS